MAFQGFDGGPRRVLGRIEEGDVTVEDQVALVGLGVRRDTAARCRLLTGDGQDAEPVGAESIVFLF